MTKISQQVLSRIAIGNYMLSATGQLTPSSDPLSVAQTVLIAHDASELILAALAQSVGFASKERTTFMEYVSEIEKAKGALAISIFFKELNGARVGFKHSGILPTPQQFHDCINEARLNLDRACRACLEMSLDQVGLEMLIENDNARQSYDEAQHHNRNGEFEKALTALGHCFREALDSTPFAYLVNVGEADTGAALRLLGCGVDPSMFLSLQEFLPSVTWNEDIMEARWDIRGTGHPGNWTRGNVDYCLDVTLKIILQIQHAPFRPHAVPFEYVFEDILTANTDGVVLTSERAIQRLLFGAGAPSRKVVGELKKGEQILGHVTPAYLAGWSSAWEGVDWEVANTLVVSNPKGTTLGDLEPGTELLIRADLVDLSYRAADYPTVRERYPHLFQHPAPPQDGE
jgi:hypothetical protein